MAAGTTPRIIVVGGGLAGLSAVIKIAEAGGKVDGKLDSTNSLQIGEVQ